MECSPLTHLGFRGERAYLHGTDIYQHLVSLPHLALSEAPFSLTFHGLLRRQPDLVCGPVDAVKLKQSPAFRGQVVAGSEAASVFLMESGREVTERRRCNEHEVTQAAQVDVLHKTASLPASACGSCIEQVVFLNKRLHLALFPGSGPWLFAKLELSKPLPPADPARLSVRLIQVLGQRFTRSEILWDGSRWGSLCFSLP